MPKIYLLVPFPALVESVGFEKFYPYSIITEVSHKDIKMSKQLNGVKETNITLVTSVTVGQFSDI